MHCVREIADKTFAIGGSDRRIELFENLFPVPDGITYNSHIILDEKTAIIDSVDNAISQIFFANIEATLQGRALDYLIVSHMEPDHCANIEEIVRRHPNVKIVGNAKTFQLIQQFYDYDMATNFLEIKDKDELDLGDHKLSFYMAPMVHWPEVFFTFDAKTNILYSADAFGTFGGFSGARFSDETNYEELYLNEARRYYTNIVGKYGMQVGMALKKVKDLPIEIIAPLHGPCLRGEMIGVMMDKYNKWSSYIPEEQGVLIACASVYGNTMNLVEMIADKLTQRGIKNIHLYDVSKTHASYLVADSFRFSHMIVAAPTYNMSLYYTMDNFLHEMITMQVKNKKVGIIGNGSWAPISPELIKDRVNEMSNMEIIGGHFLINSSFKAEKEAELNVFLDTFVASFDEK